MLREVDYYFLYPAMKGFVARLGLSTAFRTNPLASRVDHVHFGLTLLLSGA